MYHVGTHTPAGHSARVYGPLARFDPHRRDAGGDPQTDPDGRTVLYVANDLPTALCEVFGETRESLLCPRWRAAILEPANPIVVFDLGKPGAAMAIGALPALGDGNEARDLTQQWARAIFEDQPARRRIYGIRYRSAYNGGPALALWNSSGLIRTVMRGGGAADWALDSPALLARVTVELDRRRIALTQINSSECAACQRDPAP